MEPDLIEQDAIARADGARYEKKRFAFQELSKDLGKRVFLALIGPRGAGKTVLLRQLASSAEKSFYLSLDSVSLDRPLFEVVKELETKGIKRLFIDEIHFLPNFERELKKIYDFSYVQVIFTGSVSLALYDSAHDLSRRVKLFLVYPFTFDEYLFFSQGERTGKISFSDFLDTEKARGFYGKNLHSEARFDDCLKGALFPSALDAGPDKALFANILNTVLRKDLVEAGELKPDEVEDARKILRFTGLSPAEDMNFATISANTGISKHHAGKLVALLEKAFILNVVEPKGTDVRREPKILMTLPYRLLYKPFEFCIGDLREDFFVETSKAMGLEVAYLKNLRGEKTPDYYLPNPDIVLEIGGTGKSAKQFRGFPAKHRLVLTHSGRMDATHRPLFMFGMLEVKKTF